MRDFASRGQSRTTFEMFQKDILRFKLWELYSMYNDYDQLGYF